MTRVICLPRYLTMGLLLVGSLFLGTAAQGQAPAQPNNGQRPYGPAQPQQPGQVQGPTVPQGYGPPAAGNPAQANGPAMPRPVQPAGTNGQQPNGNIPVAPIGPQAPTWFPLPVEQEKYLDQVLTYWEKSSSRVQRYMCKFNRWSYDPIFVARDEKGDLPAKTISQGEIKYASPDKGLFREEKLEHFQAAKPGEKGGSYKVTEGEKGDHWVCDGKSVFLFDYPKKQLIQTELPPDMQGKAIVDGPLPFMFGAEAAKVRDRFWVRIITPNDVKGEYWLEAIPKRQEDAASFKMIRIIIDIQKHGNDNFALPKAMAIYDRGPSYQSFEFQERKINWSELPNQLNPFARSFFEPATPSGFKKIVEKYQAKDDKRVANANGLPAAPATNGQPGKPGPGKR